MAHPKLLLSLSFLLFLVVFSSSSCDGALDEPLSTATPFSVFESVDRLHFLHQDGVSRKSRKLLEGGDDLVQLDYDYAGPNPRHEPRRGRGGGRNP